jgi:hypothetical protein
MSEPAGEKDVASQSPKKGGGKVPKLSLKTPPEPPPPSLLVRLVRAPGMLASLWPLIVVIGGYLAWTQWGAERLGQQFYGLEQEQVTVTAPPEYIRRNLIAEVFTTHELDKISLLDRKATATIGEAFRLHPWVDEVLRVEKRRDGVEIQLRYRRPVAAVFVAQSDHPDVIGPCFFFVDAEGTLLPSRDFAEADAERYLMIHIADTYPSAKSEGVPYGDRRVVAAASIAALLDPLRESLQLFAIDLANPQRAYNEPWKFELVRHDGQRLVWGSPPGEEQPGEPTAEQKLERLKSAPTVPADLRVAALPATD